VLLPPPPPPLLLLLLLLPTSRQSGTRCCCDTPCVHEAVQRGARGAAVMLNKQTL
jgi:hypothetical protein